MNVVDTFREELHIDQIVAEIRELRNELRGLLKPEPEYYTLVAACKRKGVTYNSVKSRKNLQPNGGVEDVKIGGRRYWHFSTIKRWLLEVDIE